MSGKNCTPLLTFGTYFSELCETKTSLQLHELLMRYFIIVTLQFKSRRYKINSPIKCQFRGLICTVCFRHSSKCAHAVIQTRICQYHRSATSDFSPSNFCFQIQLMISYLEFYFCSSIPTSCTNAILIKYKYKR